MAIRFDTMSGFRVGQQLGQGQSALGAFVSQLTERMKQIQELQLQSQASVGTALAEQQALMPGKIQEAGAIETSKLQAQRQLAHESMQDFQSLIGGRQGTVPPLGATATINPMTGETNFNVPLNPKLTDVEATSLSTAATIRPEVQKLRDLINQSGQGEFMVSQLPFLAQTAARGVSSALPGTQGFFDRSAQIRATINRLKFGAFTLGGKQLTEGERRVLTDLADPTGKPRDVALKDLDSLDRIFELMTRAIQGGRAEAMTFSDVLAQAKGQPVPSSFTPDQYRAEARRRGLIR